MSYLFSELLAEDVEAYRGPRRKFNSFHYYRALKEILDSGRTGRARISRAIGIGEGSTRTLLDQLEEHSLVRRNNAGIVLTEKGRSEISEFPVSMAGVDETTLTTGPHSSIAVVRGGGRRVSNGIRQRDAAIKGGGAGAITMVIRGKRLLLPPDFKQVNDAAAVRVVFESLLGREGDAVIIGSGSGPIESEMATFFAALTLL